MQARGMPRPGSVIDLCPRCGHQLPVKREANHAAVALKIGGALGFLPFCLVMGVGFNIWIGLFVWGVGALLFGVKTHSVFENHRRKHGA